MLAVAWIGMSEGWRFMPRSWDSERLFIAMILAGPCAGSAGIIAGRLGPKAWYWLTVVGFGTAAIIVADVAV